MRLVDSENTYSYVEARELHDKRRRFQLARLITLSEEMLEYASTSNWDMVEELEILRRVELDECFALQNDHPSLIIAQALATLVHINDQIVHLVRAARNKVGNDHNRDKVVHLATQAYHRASE